MTIKKKKKKTKESQKQGETALHGEPKKERGEQLPESYGKKN